MAYPVNIDGQELLILNQEEKENLQSFGISDLVIDAICSYSEILKKNNIFELAVGSRKTLTDEDKWTPYILFKISKTLLQRVQLDLITCTTCSTKVLSANPTDPTLYYDCPNPHAALVNAWSKLEKKKVGCPACGKELPRASLWASLH